MGKSLIVVAYVELCFSLVISGDLVSGIGWNHGFPPAAPPFTFVLRNVHHQAGSALGLRRAFPPRRLWRWWQVCGEERKGDLSGALAAWPMPLGEKGNFFGGAPELLGGNHWKKRNTFGGLNMFDTLSSSCDSCATLNIDYDGHWWTCLALPFLQTHAICRILLLHTSARVILLSECGPAFWREYFL